MRILAHELGHVGMRFLEKVKKISTGNRGFRFDSISEEYMMRVGDEIIRVAKQSALYKNSLQLIL